MQEILQKTFFNKKIKDLDPHAQWKVQCVRLQDDFLILIIMKIFNDIWNIPNLIYVKYV